MTDFDELVTGSLSFVNIHNSRYRYSKLGGKTPLMALNNIKVELCFPTEEKAPVHPLPKLEIGRYHLVRFIRRDRKLNVFGDMFSLAPELQYESEAATVDVKEQNLKIFLGRARGDEFDYKLR